MILLLVALGGAAGSVMRYLTGHFWDGDFPRGTLLVNVVGATLLGVFSGLALEGNAAALLGTGFCGALTTYSSFAVKAHALGRGRGTVYVVATLGGALLGCFAGFALVT
ncbi:fluoride efflux transporter FluC [Nocardioides limicola]|uniref:fluoride efflux transporter FluC n=1 Tax=Nocardioides limicola TaxID=2803368 RepID=UPI00193AE5D3|nr:CrcB family protein [Nocardioides sp. DJM-14]